MLEKVSAMNMALVQPCWDKQFSTELLAPCATSSGQLLVGSAVACAGELPLMKQQELLSDILTQAETTTSHQETGRRVPISRHKIW